MAEGIYRREVGKIERGDTVAFCLEAPYKTVGLERFYMEKGSACQGADPLIKQVIAIPGDEVLLANDFIAVNVVIYPYQTRYVDRSNRPLAVYPRGRYPSIRGYWLVGTHSPYSWDSRYWGEIRSEQLRYKLKPVWVW